MNAEPPAVRLSPSLDEGRIAAAYARFGRVHIAGALENECARRLHECLIQEVPWQLHFNDRDRTYDVPGDQVTMIPEANRVLLLDAIHAKAQTRFQYLFNNFPLTDLYAAERHRELYVMRLLEYLNSSPFLAFRARHHGGCGDLAGRCPGNSVSRWTLPHRSRRRCEWQRPRGGVRDQPYGDRGGRTGAASFISSMPTTR